MPPLPNFLSCPSVFLSHFCMCNSSKTTSPTINVNLYSVDAIYVVVYDTRDFFDLLNMYQEISWNIQLRQSSELGGTRITEWNSTCSLAIALGVSYMNRCYFEAQFLILSQWIIHLPFSHFMGQGRRTFWKIKTNLNVM